MCGRYPSSDTQIITGFALFWVLQVCDHMQHFNDPQFALRFLETIHGVFGYFNRKVAPSTGLVENLPYEFWSFVDWAADWDETSESHLDNGVPVSGRETGTFTFISMLYAYTLKQAAKLLVQVNKPALLQDYTDRADSIIDSIRKHCYDGHFFTDTVSARTAKAHKYSEQTQVWAVLSGVVPVDQIYTLGRRLLSEVCAPGAAPRYTVSSFPMRHYTFRALAMTGLYENIYPHFWVKWRQMIDFELTTWCEDDIGGQRSDCHQWSSLPIWEFLSEVAGLTPLEPGWTRVRFAPRLALSEGIDARVNLGNRGTASVSWRKSSSGEYTIDLRLPQNLHLVYKLPDGTEMDAGEAQSLQLEWPHE